MKFDGFDSGFCRAYYKEGRYLYCIQDETSWGRADFRFYACSRDGEPSHEVKAPFADLAAEYKAREAEYRAN